MDNLNLELNRMIAWLHEAQPIRQHWSGDAAEQCTKTINEVIVEIRHIQARLQMTLGEQLLAGLGIGA
jgi:hypothetical protein